jgi:small-conductance mechanosensitive channel
MTARWRRGLLGAFAAAIFALAGSGFAQEAPSPADGEIAVDYQAWTEMAERVEAAIEDRSVQDSDLDTLRGQLVSWREALLGAQNANSARISTMRAQIEALGPAPVEGQTEPDDLAKRRVDLAQQLVRIQAPAIAADEAYRRADGLIREIDRTLRERQADQLLQVWPAPINPANWPEALIGLTDTGIRLWDELVENWANDARRAAFFTNLPLIVLGLTVGFLLAIIARAWVQDLAMRLREQGLVGAQRIIALLASLGEMVFPLAGVGLLAFALSLSDMLGDLGQQIVTAAPRIAVPLIVAAWMAGRIFPRGTLAGPLDLGTERRAEARVLAVLMGLMLGFEALRDAAMSAQAYSDGTTSVISFPGLVIAGLLLVRMGQLLGRHFRTVQAREGEAQNFGRSSLLLVAQACVVVGLLGPVLGAVGYVAAAGALVYPATLSLGLIAVLLILQHLVGDIYAMITRHSADAGDALLPVLANFMLAVASLPILALIWGARVADITEIWTRFRDGFQFGSTRISPTDFVLLAAVFAIGYGLTRLFQGALKTSILPRTGLDQGAQNAAVSGVGYIGVILAALIAINTAGIDLSGLAIVAGALSVGIGFGLQNIVSNFVSGIILLVERPVSEGDWIEVGSTSGIVKSISVRSTRIQTFDRADVIVPNTDLVAGRVTNWTRFNLTGRLVVTVGVDFGSDSRKVERVLREIAESQPLVIMNPPPVVALMELGADSINFEIRMILRDVNQIVAVRSEVNHEILRRFAQEGIEIPFAQNDVTLRNAGEIADMLRAPSPKTAGT